MVVTIILGGGFVILLAFSFLIMNELRIGRAAIDSMQAYYAAEAGIEDILLRLQPGYVLPTNTPYTWVVGSSSVQVTVGNTVGGTRTIVADGTRNGKSRRVTAVATTVTTNASFFYGAQIGDGGLSMGSNTQITGNTFSNGNIIGAGKTSSIITGTAVAAKDSMIQSVGVGADAYANSLDNCTITGVAYYFTSITNCGAGAQQMMSSTISSIAFPLSTQQIANWQADAAAGGTLSGYSVPNNQSRTLGPIKIDGNLSLGNNSVLTLTGTIWVTGTITFGNSVTIQLDPGYQSLSGVMVVDGAITTGNTTVLRGTGQVGSYLMIVTNATGNALTLGNSATGAIFYAPNGTVQIGNNLDLKEVTAYRLVLGNNATITYETGLANVSFSSGPGGRWTAATWQETP